MLSWSRLVEILLRVETELLLEDWRCPGASASFTVVDARPTSLDVDVGVDGVYVEELLCFISSKNFLMFSASSTIVLASAEPGLAMICCWKSVLGAMLSRRLSEIELLDGQYGKKHLVSRTDFN